MNDVTWVIVFFFVGLILGLLIAWLYCRRRASAHETRIHDLELALKKKEVNLQDVQGELTERESRLQELDGRVRQQEGTIQDLNVRVQGLAQVEPEDLTIVEGIGPKISSLLGTAGIVNYAQLAAAAVDRLREIVRDAGLAMVDPGTWPEQARLAADAKWDELETLQEELKGGRRA